MRPALGVCTCAVILIFSTSAAGQGRNGTGALSDEDTRLTTGLESVSAASTGSKQHLLIDFMVTAPLSATETTREEKPWFGAWLNARFNGSPSTSVSGIKQFVGGFENDLVAGDTSSLLNTLSFRAGLEIKIPGMNGATFDKDYQFQPLIIAAIGVQTVPALGKPAIFVLSDEARAKWKVGDDQNIKHIAFTEPDRRRFHRTFELGVRLKTHHFADCDSGRRDCSRNDRVNFPGIVDLTLGQDASITGGSRRGVVGRIDAFYPLPTDSIANAVYLFGAIRAHWADGIPVEERPIILRAPDATVVLPSPEVFIHTLTSDERSRDEWKFGIGMDLVRLFTAATKGREEDEINLAPENGSSVAFHDDTAVLVERRLIQRGETVTFNHGTDVVIPMRKASLLAKTIPAGGQGPINLVEGEIRMELATRRQLQNTESDNFEMILVRIKPGEAKSDRLLGFAAMDTTNNASAKVDETVVHQEESRYKVSRVKCDANCELSSSAETDNLLIVVPLKNMKVRIGAEEEATKNAYQPFHVGRKTALTVKGDTEFAVVRLR